MNNMTESNTIVVVDKDGIQHWASRQAAFVVDGLADGSLREVDDAPVSAPSPDLDDGDTDSGPDDGESDVGNSDDSGDDRVAGSTTSRSSRRRS